MMRRLVATISFFVLLCLTGTASAALPPLSDSQRQNEATEVVSGRVLVVYTRRKTMREGFSNQEMLLEITIEEVLKGNLQKERTVFAKCWTIDERPQGWVGDGGQRPLPRIGDSGTFYMNESKAGVFHLLTPNGWDRD